MSMKETNLQCSQCGVQGNICVQLTTFGWMLTHRGFQRQYDPYNTTINHDQYLAFTKKSHIHSWVAHCILSRYNVSTVVD